MSLQERLAIKPQHPVNFSESIAVFLQEHFFAFRVRNQ